MVLGFRGELDSGWDWDTGIVISKATMEDTTANRISAIEFVAGLNDMTCSNYKSFFCY